MKLIIRKTEVHLLPEKALYIPKMKLLAVADLHLGKDTTFRRAGISVPEGSMKSDLERLSHLLKKYDVETCVITGDLIHARSGLTEQVSELIKLWCNKQTCKFVLVLGNHDKALKKLKQLNWNLEIVEEYTREPFHFVHEPLLKRGYFVWCGHIHPVINLEAKHDRLRLPCFHIQSRVGILPSFGAFTGGYTIRPSEKDKIYVTTGQEVIKI